MEVVSSNVGRGYESNLVTAFKAQKSTQNRYLGLPSRLSFGTRIAGADQGDWLSRITFLWSMSCTCLCISFRRAYGVLYWGRLTGFASPTSIWCPITLVPLKSFVFSWWKTWAYFLNTGSICFLSSSVKWFSFPLSNFWYKASFSFCLCDFVVVSKPDSFPAFILSISASDTSSARPKQLPWEWSVFRCWS